MNLKTIGIIIRREYTTRVRKKSFLVTTIIVPILMAALCIVPIVLMMNSKGKQKVVAYVDRSGIVAEKLVDSEAISFVDCGDADPAVLKEGMKEMGFDAVLSISELDVDARTVAAELTSVNALGIEITEGLSRRINDAVRQYRIASYNISNLESIMKEIEPDVRLRTFTRDDEGNEQVSEAGVNSVVSMLLGLVLFLFITLFGGMVMSAVIEEKSSRVVEVLVSSVKATELMFGKIIGIAFVALTQFLLWIAFTVLLVSAAGAVAGPELMSKLNPGEAVTAAGGVNMPGVDTEALMTAAAQGEDGGIVADIVGTVAGMNIAKILVVFLVFFLFGYLLYASLYAAIGSAVENEGDSQQLQLPVTIPLMIAYFIAIYAFNAPDSTIAVWGSMIPFTSPIVMIARIPFGVPDWQLALSIALLVLTFGVCAWISAKIYKVGILMFGKKTTYKDLWKWLKQN